MRLVHDEWGMRLRKGQLEVVLIQKGGVQVVKFLLLSSFNKVAHILWVDIRNELWCYSSFLYTFNQYFFISWRWVSRSRMWGYDIWYCDLECWDPSYIIQTLIIVLFRFYKSLGSGIWFSMLLIPLSFMFYLLLMWLPISSMTHSGYSPNPTARRVKFVMHFVSHGVISLLLAIPWRLIFFSNPQIQRYGKPLPGCLIYLLSQNFLVFFNVIDQFYVFL